MKAQSLWFVLAFVSCGAAGRCPEVCVLDDVKCVTRGSSNNFKAVVGGPHGSPLDPFHLDSLDGIRGSTKYTLRNIELRGFRNCVVTELRLNVTENEYLYYLHCPKLTSSFNYEVKKTSGSPAQIKWLTVTAYDYYIRTLGQYGVIITAKDHQPHFVVERGLSRTYIEGKLIFDVKDLIGTGHQSNNKDIQKETVECLFSIIVRKAVTKLIAGIDTYCRTHLMGEVLPAHQC